MTYHNRTDQDLPSPESYYDIGATARHPAAFKVDVHTKHVEEIKNDPDSMDCLFFALAC